MIRKWKEDLTDIGGKIEFWTRAIVMFFYELLIEWLKLTTTVIIMLLIPLTLYILWDMIYSDFEMASYLLASLSDWMNDHFLFCSLLVFGMCYITYL